ncbi:MAG: non-canonical purine NTP pyrophosphatase, partial [Planctomycetota bacterium]
MTVRREILVGSGNPGKLAELRDMLGGEIKWVGLADFPGIGEIAEDGESFAENAQKKALGYAKATGLWTIADDSGLVVDALDGEPGVRSARFSGEKEENRRLLDHKNMTKVLGLLEDVPRERRTARFVCHLCLASPEEVLIEAEGKLEGVINDREVGENGFGYDPIFFVPQLNKTVAQLWREEKNA